MEPLAAPHKRWRNAPVVGNGSAPHPEKAHFGGEDALMALPLWIGSRVILAIADGVGGSRYDGDDERKVHWFVWHLLYYLQHYLWANPGCSVDEAVAVAQASTPDNGATTTLCCVDLEPGRPMRVWNVGDCRAGLFRNGDCVWANPTQQRYHNCPRQFGGGSHNAQDLRYAEEVEVDVQPGDLIIIASDGFWDNVPIAVVEAKLASRAWRGRSVQGITNALLAMAKRVRSDPFTLTPHAINAVFNDALEELKDGSLEMIADTVDKLYCGGKLDDVTLLVTRVPEVEEVEAPAQFDWGYGRQELGQPHHMSCAGARDDEDEDIQQLLLEEGPQEVEEDEFETDEEEEEDMEVEESQQAEAEQIHAKMTTGSNLNQVSISGGCIQFGCLPIFSVLGEEAEEAQEEDPANVAIHLQLGLELSNSCCIQFGAFLPDALPVSTEPSLLLQHSSSCTGGPPAGGMLSTSSYVSASGMVPEGSCSVAEQPAAYCQHVETLAAPCYHSAAAAAVPPAAGCEAAFVPLADAASGFQQVPGHHGPAPYALSTHMQHSHQGGSPVPAGPGPQEQPAAADAAEWGQDSSMPSPAAAAGPMCPSMPPLASSPVGCNSSTTCNGGATNCTYAAAAAGVMAGPQPISPAAPCSPSMPCRPSSCQGHGPPPSNSASCYSNRCDDTPEAINQEYVPSSSSSSHLMVKQAGMEDGCDSSTSSKHVTKTNNTSAGTTSSTTCSVSHFAYNTNDDWQLHRSCQTDPPPVAAGRQTADAGTQWEDLPEMMVVGVVVSTQTCWELPGTVDSSSQWEETCPLEVVAAATQTTLEVEAAATQNTLEVEAAGPCSSQMNEQSTDAPTADSNHSQVEQESTDVPSAGSCSSQVEQQSTGRVAFGQEQAAGQAVAQQAPGQQPSEEEMMLQEVVAGQQVMQQVVQQALEVVQPASRPQEAPQLEQLPATRPVAMAAAAAGREGSAEGQLHTSSSGSGLEIVTTGSSSGARDGDRASDSDGRGAPNTLDDDDGSDGVGDRAASVSTTTNNNSSSSTKQENSGSDINNRDVATSPDADAGPEGAAGRSLPAVASPPAATAVAAAALISASSQTWHDMMQEGIEGDMSQVQGQPLNGTAVLEGGAAAAGRHRPSSSSGSCSSSSAPEADFSNGGDVQGGASAAATAQPVNSDGLVMEAGSSSSSSRVLEAAGSSNNSSSGGMQHGAAGTADATHHCSSHEIEVEEDLDELPAAPQPLLPTAAAAAAAVPSAGNGWGVGRARRQQEKAAQLAARDAARAAAAAAAAQAQQHEDVRRLAAAKRERRLERAAALGTGSSSSSSAPAAAEDQLETGQEVLVMAEVVLVGSSPAADRQKGASSSSSGGSSRRGWWKRMLPGNRGKSEDKTAKDSRRSSSSTGDTAAASDRDVCRARGAATGRDEVANLTALEQAA